MRRSRRLTSAERWELGLFLSLLIVTCLCLTALLNLNGIPRMFAADSIVDASAAVAPAAPQQEQILPQIEPAPTPAVMTVQQQSLPLPAEQQAVTPIEPARQPKATARPAKAQPEIKTYKGQKYRYVKTITLRVTAYAPDARCCFPYPGTTTASGLSVKTNGGKLVAADPSVIPLHSLVVVPGYASGNAVPVLDTGGAIKGKRLDVLLPTFSTAKDWGSQNLQVKIYEPIN